jgi:hypothetical protein
MKAPRRQQITTRIGTFACRTFLRGTKANKSQSFRPRQKEKLVAEDFKAKFPRPQRLSGKQPGKRKFRKVSAKSIYNFQ